MGGWEDGWVDGCNIYDTLSAFIIIVDCDVYCFHYRPDGSNPKTQKYACHINHSVRSIKTKGELNLATIKDMHSFTLY